MELARKAFTQLGVLTASPYAFLTVVVYGALWVVIEPETFDWHGIATLATWLMTLFIQRAEHRDTQAIHAKLDELLRADRNAESAVADVDNLEPEDIERRRDAERRDS